VNGTAQLASMSACRDADRGRGTQPCSAGKVRSFDATAAKAIPVSGTSCRSRAASPWLATAIGGETGRDALEVTWDEGPVAQVSSASISSLFASAPRKTAPSPATTATRSPRWRSGRTRRGRVRNAVLAHATMEPMNCTAHVRADGVDIWAPTQFQTGVQMAGGKSVGTA